jgi:hypothetical protein
MELIVVSVTALTGYESATSTVFHCQKSDAVSVYELCRPLE